MTKSGFTLIELLISLTLLLIMGGVGVAGYRQSARRGAVDGVQGQIMGMFRQAQINAQSGKKVGCLTALDGWQVLLTATTATLQEVCGATTHNSTMVAFAPNVTLTTLPVPNPILFKVLNRGTNINTIAGLGVSGFGWTKAVVITPNGEIKTSETVPTPVPTATAGPTPTPSPTATPTWIVVGSYTVGCNHNVTVSYTGRQMRFQMTGGGGGDARISFGPTYNPSPGAVWRASDNSTVSIVNNGGDAGINIGTTLTSSDFGSIKTINNQTFQAGCNDGETMQITVSRYGY